MNQRRMYRRKFAFPFFALVALLLVSAIVQWLWNAILPSLVNVNPISYWKAMGLLILCKILFGSFGGRPGGPRWGERHNAESDPGGFRPSWRRKWMQMTDEERIKFKQELRNRCRKPPKDL